MPLSGYTQASHGSPDLLFLRALPVLPLRDVFILGAKQGHLPGKLFLYSVLMFLCLPGATGIAHSLSEQRAIALLGSPWVWTTVLAIHAGQWRFAAWVKHGPHRKDRMWLTIVAPAPMFLLSAVVFSNRVAASARGAGALTAGLIVFAIWTASVLAGVLAFRFVYRGWEDWDCVAEIAEQVGPDSASCPLRVCSRGWKFG
jgi:hypothetical protein